MNCNRFLMRPYNKNLYTDLVYRFLLYMLCNVNNSHFMFMRILIQISLGFFYGISPRQNSKAFTGTAFLAWFKASFFENIATNTTFNFISPPPLIHLFYSHLFSPIFYFIKLTFAKFFRTYFIPLESRQQFFTFLLLVHLY